MEQILDAVLQTFLKLPFGLFYLLCFWKGCRRRSLTLASLPLKFPCLFVDFAVRISLPGAVWLCCLLTASCCFASLALFVSFVLAISCFLSCRRLNKEKLLFAFKNLILLFFSFLFFLIFEASLLKKSPANPSMESKIMLTFPSSFIILFSW